MTLKIIIAGVISIASANYIICGYEEKRIKEDKRHPGVIMELKKSEVIWDIVRLIRLKVITYNDLSDFSDELQNEVKRILEMSR